MSVAVMGLVWGSALPPNQRLVLLAYSDHANDEGGSVYPGEQRMADKTGYSPGTIRRVTADLIAAGWLFRVKTGHRGQRAEFRVNVAQLVDHVSMVKGAHDARLSDGKGAQSEPERRAYGDEKARAGDTPNVSEPSDEPSLRSVDAESSADVSPGECDHTSVSVTGDSTITCDHCHLTMDRAGWQSMIANQLAVPTCEIVGHSWGVDQLSLYRCPSCGAKRDLLWEVFTGLHGAPATNGERGKFNRFVKQLRDAGVDHREYPVLVRAYVSKYGNQPAVATVPERIGEMRHYAEHGPMVAPTAEELAAEREWQKVLEDHDQEGLPE